MKNLIRPLTFLTLTFVLNLACTKDITLKTEVEFNLLTEHTAEGYINEDLSTTVTVVPEVELEELSYTYSYSVSEGEGYFKDSNGTIFPQHEEIALNPLSADLMYVGSKTGAHLVQVTARDNYGFSEEVDIDYFLLDTASVIWTANSTIQRIELGNSATIRLRFVESDLNLEMEYERGFTLVSGSGELTIAPGQNTVDMDAFESIVPGIYEFEYTPDALGTSELSFILRDANGEELSTTVIFEVLDVVVDPVDQSSEKFIEEFEIDGVVATISGTTISLTLPSGTDSRALVPNITFTGASLSPVAGSSKDFTDPVDYTVTAEDGSTMIYIVTVSIAESNEKEIQSFSIAGISGVFGGPNNTNITVTLPAGTDEKSLSPAILHTGDSIEPQSGSTIDFTDTVTFTVTAENGSQSNYTVTVIIEDDAPMATASADTMTTFINQDVSFTGSLSTDDIRIDSYSWDFGDGNISTQPDPVHRYAAYGDYTVTLLVTDDGGLTDTAIITVSIINQAPVAIASANRMSISPGQSISFTGSGSTDDLAVTSYDWNFGDGRSSTSADTANTYTCSGTYEITLMVSDAEGLTDSTTVTIIVTAPTSVTFNATTGVLSGPPGASVPASISIARPGFANLNGPGDSATVCSSVDSSCPYPTSDSITFTIPACGSSSVSATVNSAGDTSDVTAMVTINGQSYTISRDSGIPSN